jgi:hypothetical protein
MKYSHRFSALSKHAVRFGLFFAFFGFAIAFLPTRALADSVLTSPGTLTADENGTIDFSLAGLVSSVEPISSYTILRGPYDGSLAYMGLGDYAYTPNNYYFGSDAFTFIATDSLGTVSNPSNLFITVNEVPVPPEVSTGFFSTTQNTPAEILLSTLATPTNMVPISSYAIGVPSDGTIADFDPSTGVFFYAPNPGFTGVDLFPWSATADGKTADSTIVVSVEPPTVTSAAEPSSVALLALGLGGLAALSLRRKQMPAAS